MPSLLPTLPTTHRWVDGGAVITYAGRNVIGPDPDARVWCWDTDTGERVTDLYDVDGNTVTTLPVLDNTFTAGVPVTVFKPVFSIGPNGRKIAGLDHGMADSAADSAAAAGDARDDAQTAAAAAGASADLAADAVSAVTSRGSTVAALTPGASGQGRVTVAPATVTGPTAAAYDAFPGCARTPDGRLVLVWRGGPAHTGGTDGRIYLSTSRDLGRTWSPPVQVLDDALDLRDPSIAVSRDGTRWWITYFTYNNPSTPNTRAWVITSTDAGLTWGPPVALSGNERAVAAPLVEAADGTLYAAVYGPTGGKDAAYSVSSSDGGASWSGENAIGVNAGVDFQEPCLVIAPNGAVTCVARYNNQDRICVSTLSGGVWSTPVAKFVGWGAPRTVATATGALVCVYRDTATGYAALARTSRDNGDTWTTPVTVDAATTQMVYAAPVEVAPGLVCCPYAVDVSGGADLRVRYLVDGDAQTPFGDTVAPRRVLTTRSSSVLLADSFARPDGPLGDPDFGPVWTGGSYSIIGGAAEPNVVGSVAFTISDIGVADCELEADLTWLGNSGCALVFRYTSESDHLMLTSETSGANFRLYKVVSGTATQLATASAVQAKTFDGVKMRWGVSMKGNRVNTYLDGALILSYDLTGDANLSTFAGKTKVGLRGNNNIASTHHRCTRFVATA